jgi:TRAP-type C4-dicarboxylate transport system permease small subunit
MHPLRHPRNAALVGIIFVVIAVIFWAVPYYGGWHIDYAGVTMLAVLGIAMALMAYVLVAGSTND